uniref:C2H2-type domain-containing protein n=1 Tax=Caenorhabditis japonica TaxID=281687 RepID=A0A8R1DRR5_CAEJA
MNVSSPRNTYRKNPAELKRPDLQGSFICGSCGELFQHAPSLNRHRLEKHADEVTCLLCAKDERSGKLEKRETVRTHMLNFHSIKAYTCSCCNWSFPMKQLLTAHCKSMNETGKPGDVKPCAISTHAPGALSQQVLQGRPRKVAVRRNRNSLSASSSSSASSASSSSPPPPPSSLNELAAIQETVKVKHESPEVMSEKKRFEKRNHIAMIGDALARKAGIIE